MSNNGVRQGHAVLDLPSRSLKAIKIARLLGEQPGGATQSLLEIGCGSGGIAHWFGKSGEMCWDVQSVDVEDIRLVRDGYSFTLVAGTELPFPDSTFDVVVTNHVIEHVGETGAQRKHLSEIWRVLKPSGIVYLAVPNRWMLIEPHFKLPFLSWLPLALADFYVRLAGKGTHYDCRPLTCRSLEEMLEECGFTWVQHTGAAVRLTFELERPNAPIYRGFMRHIPDKIYFSMRRLFPTLIYTLKRRDAP